MEAAASSSPDTHTHTHTDTTFDTHAHGTIKSRKHTLGALYMRKHFWCPGMPQIALYVRGAKAATSTTSTLPTCWPSTCT